MAHFLTQPVEDDLPSVSMVVTTEENLLVMVASIYKMRIGVK